MNIFFEKTLYIYTSSSLHNEMIKIMFEKIFKKIEVLDALEPSQKILQNNAIFILDDCDENHQSIIEFLKNQKIQKNQPRLTVLDFIMSYSASVETLKSQKITILVKNN